MRQWRKETGEEIPVWITHGTGLAQLRGFGTPYDGDVDIAFLGKDQSRLTNVWKPENMVRWKKEFRTCSKMRGNANAEQFRKLHDKATGKGLDMWDFKPQLDGMTVNKSFETWSSRLGLSGSTPQQTPLLCKWLCLEKKNVFPLKPCYLYIPTSDTDYGPITRVEKIEAVCGSNYNSRFAELYEPYIGWQFYTPYNWFNQSTRRWEFSFDVLRSFVMNGTDQIVYDNQQLVEATKSQIKDLKANSVLTPEANITAFKYPPSTCTGNCNIAKHHQIF